MKTCQAPAVPPRQQKARLQPGFILSRKTSQKQALATASIPQSLQEQCQYMTLTPAEPELPAASSPIPVLEWRPPYCPRTIRRNTETELRHGNDEH